jgi:DNA-directed RNA polymerase specialized sigma54-like protein
MFAVLKTNSNDVVNGRSYCCHLSIKRDRADKFVTDRKNVSSSGTYSVHEVNSLTELEKFIMPQVEAEKSEDILEELLKKLDNFGFTAESAEKLTQQVQEKGEKAIAEVRSLGIRGMKAVGDGFVVFGDLLKAAADKDE